MDLANLVLIACALAMDAFAVSICKGLSANNIHTKEYILVGAYFGGFQALMPLLGYMLGYVIADYIEALDHWIAFLLLGLIGTKMIKDSFNEKCELEQNPFNMKSMFPLAIATSIDSLVIGISFGLLLEYDKIVLGVLIIGVVTALFSMIGLRIGNIQTFAQKLGAKAHFVGGVVLIAIGVKILIEHLGL